MTNQHGGKRAGAGNKPVLNPLPVKTIRCTDSEKTLVMLYLKEIREVLKMKLAGKTWGSLTANKKDSLLRLALPVSGIDGTTVDDGECTVDFQGLVYSIPGEVIDSEVIIKDSATFYNPVE